MPKKVVIATGCDAQFYPFMLEALGSLHALRLDDRADFGILDLGLRGDQKSELSAMGCIIRRPTWTLPVDQALSKPHEVGLVARTDLRSYFEGYDVYLWFDADAWAQTPEFFDLFVDGAIARGAAVVRENGRGMRRNWLYSRWWFGHMIASCGVVDGFRVSLPAAINLGIVALASDAPHWAVWREMYRHMIVCRGKASVDQHAFNAAVHLRSLPTALLPARCNWVVTLSQPQWNPATKQLWEPRGPNPISVVHLAGPDKRRTYDIESASGGKISTALTHTDISALTSNKSLAA
jgi:hypothetical protein